MESQVLIFGASPGLTAENLPRKFQHNRQNLSAVIFAIVGHALQVNDVLDVLRENFAGVCGGENGVDESPFLGNLKHGVEVGGEIGLEIPSFAAVA